MAVGGDEEVNNTMRRGINGHAELVIEILSPHDESRQKQPFYAKCGIPAFWIIDPDALRGVQTRERALRAPDLRLARDHARATTAQRLQKL